MPTIPINDDTTRDEYTATGGQTTFAYTFWIKDEAHLDVYQNGTLLTLTTHYTVSGTQSDTGANVVLVTGATVNDEIVIAYNPDVERLSEFTTSGTFTAAALNLELSYIISLLQYLDTERARTIAFAADDTSGVSPTIPSGLAAGEMLQVNSGGTALQRVLPADLDLTSVSAFMATVMDDTTAAAARTTLDAQQLDATLTALAGWANGTDKVPYTTATDTVASLDFLDEDTMSSDSATAVASQQSIKAYVDTTAAKDWELITATTASSDASVAFTGLSSTYAAYMIVIEGVGPDTDGTNFLMRTSTDNGATYDSGASDYAWAVATVRDDGTQAGVGDTADSAIPINRTSQGSNGAVERDSHKVTLYNPSSTNYTQMTSESWICNNSATPFRYISNMAGHRASAADVDAIQFLYSSGNIAVGEFRLYGLKGA